MADITTHIFRPDNINITLINITLTDNIDEQH